jgi:hypothetical protein
VLASVHRLNLQVALSIACSLCHPYRPGGQNDFAQELKIVLPPKYTAVCCACSLVECSEHGHHEPVLQQMWAMLLPLVRQLQDLAVAFLR